MRCRNPSPEVEFRAGIRGLLGIAGAKYDRDTCLDDSCAVPTGLTVISNTNPALKGGAKIFRAYGARWSPGQAKICAAIVIGLGGRWHIQLRDGNFSGALFGEDPESFADDGVILDFLGVSIAEHQQGLGVDLGFGWRRWRWVLRRPRFSLVSQARHFLVQTINLILLELAVRSVRV